ncbi:MAG: insulinase family protein [Gemmatimonadetes bacterium]|nr:insulinase family protein [Gemmatimonadota bacterium]NNK61995.1 insulinase family protein [Gemmatimonadota bacterium]
MSASPDRTQAPEPGALRPFRVPGVHTRRLSNGLELHVVPLPRLPVVTAAFVFPSGGETGIPRAQAGRAALAAQALEGGTRRRSGTALAEALEAVGADVGVSAGWDSAVASVSTLTDRWAEGMDLLAEMVLAPSFPDAEVERVRDQVLARIRQRSKDPSALAADRSIGFYFAADEPYGRPVRGTEATIEGLGPSDLRDWVERAYRPDGAGLVVAGDIDPDEAQAVLEPLVAGWEGRATIPEAPAGRARHEEAAVHIVHRPGSVQSELRLGHPGAPRAIPDHPALVVANSVLGGTFGSRLNMNLRESRGFTYGVRSGFAFRRGPGPFSISTAVDTDVTADAVREAVGELRRYVAEGPSEDEVRAARDYIAGVFPLRLETTGGVAMRVAELLVHDLPDDAWTRYREDIRAVDANAAHAAVRRHMQPDRLVCVVVGDAEKIAPGLEALELGPVTVHRDEAP